MQLVVGMAIATLASVGVFAAPAVAAETPGTPAAAGACTAGDAPQADNTIRASGDCEPEQRYGTRAATLSPVPASTAITAMPKSFDTTDGDILAITRVSGASTPELAIGGNFGAVITPDGVSHPARNFAIVEEGTGAVRYAGNADSYVRAIASRHGVTYVGGDFTTFGGHARPRAAAVSPAGAVTAWNPAPSGRVRGMTADDGGVYLTGDFGAVRKVSLHHGVTYWSKGITAGSGRVLKIADGWLYAGGLFETYDGHSRHGLVKIDPGSGAFVGGFDAHLRRDSGSGSYGGYDGEGVLALSLAANGRLLVGIGGRAPAGSSSNELMEVGRDSGNRAWTSVLIGDCQAVASVGATVVGGYHRNGVTSDTPSPQFAAQFNSPNGAWTTWDPRLSGTQSNADGGNNGVQAMYADAATGTLFVAGAFTTWNGAPRQSLAAFAW